MAERIQLRRSRGWRMPPNTIKVDRTTPWGNPFIVGANGTAAECVYKFILMCGGYMCISDSGPCYDRQQAITERLKKAKASGYAPLRGRNLACWCKPGAPCHADILLIVANKPKRERMDLAAIMAGFGYRVENGECFPLGKSGGA